MRKTATRTQFESGKTGASSDRSPSRRRFFVGLAFSITVLLAALAWSDIYHYVDSDGNHYFTTSRQRGMELVEVIRADGSSGGSSSGSSGSRSSGHSQRYDTAAFDEFIAEASAEYDIPVPFIKGVIHAESAFNPRAVSRSGAQGLMQLMPATGEEMGVEDPFDPRDNIFGGTRYLRILSDRFRGDVNLVLAAYNAGPGNVADANGIPFEATRGYVRSVYRHYVSYLEAE